MPAAFAAARELRTLVTEAWRMVVPRSVAAAYDRERSKKPG